MKRSNLMFKVGCFIQEILIFKYENLFTLRIIYICRY